MEVHQRITYGLAVLALGGVVACSSPDNGQSVPTRAPASAEPAPPIAVAPFGKVDDTPVQLFTLTNKIGRAHV